MVAGDASARDIAEFLDGLPPQTRVRTCLSIPGHLLAPLYARVRGHGLLEISVFASPPRQTIVYELKNSLRLFNTAQKRFYQPTRGDVIGFNYTGSLAPLTGPGYFYALNGDDGELVFDYTRLPDFRPPGWPEIRPNTGIVAGATYGNTIDYVRMVSRHTVVGAAFRGGKPRNAYFLLTRSAAQS